MMTNEELMRLQAAVVAGTSSPMRKPFTMEGQVQAQLQNLDPRAMPSEAQTRAWAKQDAAKRAVASTAGLEGRLKAQQAYADRLRGSEMSQGRTVGPYNVYVGPTWGDALAHVGRQAAGGYLQSQLTPEYEKLGEAQAEAQRANLEYQDILKQEERGFTAGESALDRSLRRELQEGQQEFAAGESALERGFRAGESALERGFRAGESELTREAQRTLQELDQDFEAKESALAATRAMALETMKQNNLNLRDAELVSYYNTEPDGPPVNTYIKMGNKVYDNTMNEVDVTDRTPYAAVSPQSLTKAEMDADANAKEQALSAEMGITALSPVFRSPAFTDSSGLGWSSVWTGATGFQNPLDEQGVAIQDNQRRVQKYMTFDGMASDFQRLDLGQITKNEFDNVFKANPNWKSEPYGLVMAYADTIPLYMKKFNEGIKRGSHTYEQRDAHINALKDDVIYGAMQLPPSSGIDFVQQLEDKGINVRKRFDELFEKAKEDVDSLTQKERDLLKIMAENKSVVGW